MHIKFGGHFLGPQWYSMVLTKKGKMTKINGKNKKVFYKLDIAETYVPTHKLCACFKHKLVSNILINHQFICWWNMGYLKWGKGRHNILLCKYISILKIHFWQSNSIRIIRRILISFLRVSKILLACIFYRKTRRQIVHHPYFWGHPLIACTLKLQWHTFQGYL